MTTNHQTSIASLAKKRRTYSAEFKQQIVQACKAPDVSIASVALQHGLNTNLVSKWIRLIDGKPGNDRSPLPNKPAFIALSCSNFRKASALQKAVRFPLNHRKHTV